MTLSDLKSEFSHAYVCGVARAAGYFMREANPTFDGDCLIDVSGALAAGTPAVPWLQRPLRVRCLADCDRGCLPWHRQPAQTRIRGGRG